LRAGLRATVTLEDVLRQHNLDTLQGAYNPQPLAGSGGISAPSAGAGAGFGKGESAAGAAAASGGFGFFGRIGLRTFGGGPVGLSSANTGLGSTVVEAGLVKSPGIRIT